HNDRFAKEVERLTADAPIYEKAATGHAAVSYSQELYLEFDEFLVQYKSSLDYLAKLPATLLGWNKWNRRTFGERGKRIIKMLRSVWAWSSRPPVLFFCRSDWRITVHIGNYEALVGQCGTSA